MEIAAGPLGWRLKGARVCIPKSLRFVVARDFVAVRESSVAFERVFSARGLAFAYEDVQSCERSEGGRRRETQPLVESAAYVLWKVDYYEK